MIYLLIAILKKVGREKNDIKRRIQKRKENQQKKIILLQSGSFYVTFFQDAEILSYLFSYKIHDDKVGFPTKNLEKVLFELRSKKLNYVIIRQNKKDILYDEEESNYFTLLKVASSYSEESLKIGNLLEEIQYILEVNPRYYQKIKDFIDEL